MWRSSTSWSLQLHYEFELLEIQLFLNSLDRLFLPLEVSEALAFVARLLYDP